MPERAIGAILDEAQLVEFDHAGVGYFLTVSHPELSVERMVSEGPTPYGTAEGVLCGFVAFIENRELTLECYDLAFQDRGMPEDIRERNIEISTNAEAE